jgi:SAM-dependent methyltransferase
MIQINEEFKKLIPALTNEEFKQLEANCIREGIREKIITLNGFIIDGHNRFEIATKHKLKFETESKEFESDDDVKIWMIDNQEGRRNLTDGWKYKLKNTKKEILFKKGEAKRIETKIGNNNASKTKLSIIDNVVLPKHNTQKIIANELGWSTGKTAMADIVFKKATPELEEKVLSNEITINQAYKEIKKEEKNQIKLNERDRLAEIGKNKKIEIDFRLGDFEEVFADLPDGSIDCIITDPPYPYEFIEVWTKLSRFAKRVLKPNGYCISYSGQMYLPEVIKRMNEHLDYYWTFAVYHEGQTQIVNGINLMCRWKPVLIFQNGKKKIENTFQDYFISEQREKNGHDWQQSKSGVGYLIEMFTKEGDTIFEPFAGSGTTIIAARDKNRNILSAEIDEKTYNIAKALL